MGRLFDLSTGKQIATISQEQISFLTSHLEEEDSSDVDYYLDRNTFDYLKEAKTDVETIQEVEELLTILESTLGDKDAIDIAYDDVDLDAPYSVTGCVIDRNNNEPLPGLKVEIWDVDLLLDDYLGWAFTDEEGRFTVTYQESDFRDSGLDNIPDILLIIKKWQDEQFSVLKEIKLEHKSTGKDDFGNIEV